MLWLALVVAITLHAAGAVKVQFTVLGSRTGVYENVHMQLEFSKGEPD